METPRRTSRSGAEDVRKAPLVRALCAVAAGLLAGTPVPADAPLGALRLATCAALWEGYADVLGDEGERALAAEFRAAAIRLAGRAETDALIAERRPWAVDLLTAYVQDQDDQSRELFERMVTTCGRLAADLPYIAP